MLRVLDSTVLIDYLRGRPAVDRVTALRAAGDVAATTGVNVEEIVRGLRPSEMGAARSLFDGLLILAIGRHAGWQAGVWRREFATRGVPLCQSDCLIAAVTFQHGATLLTGNPQAFPMPGLHLDHWRVGQ